MVAPANPQCPYWNAPRGFTFEYNSSPPNLKYIDMTIDANLVGQWVPETTGDLQGAFADPSYALNRSPWAMIGGGLVGWVDSYISDAPQPVPPPPP